jgi:tripartite-type tricarboxylate transporter receptor subunit TctC
MNKGFSCLVAGLALFAASTPAVAQAAYPTRPIRVIVPYPAGGIVDIVARSVTNTLAKNFKQTMVVEAKPGGNSNMGTAEVARSAPDGYTWLVTGWSIPRSTRTPAGTRCATSNASGSWSGIRVPR